VAQPVAEPERANDAVEPVAVEPAPGDAQRQLDVLRLPEPDGPMIALKRPAVNDAETPPRAVTAASPLP
jgi:hypothetical protein